MCRASQDADRLISRFAGTQFCLEGLSTASLLWADLGVLKNVDSAQMNAEMNASSVNSTQNIAASGWLWDDVLLAHLQWQIVGFFLSLAAMLVPIVQLFEQRLCTPTILLVRDRGANPIVLLAAAWYLLVSLPSMAINLVTRAQQGVDSASTNRAAMSATADAGDDGGGGQLASRLSTNNLAHESDDIVEEAGSAEETDFAGVSPGQVVDTALDVSKLLARGIAAKEVVGKQVGSAAAKKTSSPSLRSASSTGEPSPGEAPSHVPEWQAGVVEGGADETPEAQAAEAVPAAPLRPLPFSASRAAELRQYIADSEPPHTPPA